MRNKITAGFALALAFTFFGCDSKPTNSNLVGTWERLCNANLQSKEIKMLPASIEFFNDGAGIFYERESETGHSIKWQLRDGNRLQVDAGVFGTQINDIELSEKGTILVYHHDGLKFDGKNPRKAIYIKKGEREGIAAKSSFTFTDVRDGKKYKAVKIGGQSWMAENLNFDIEDSKCYEDKPENCKKYGRLYNWETAMRVCPEGWFLPTIEEWSKLSEYVNGSYRCADGTDNYNHYKSTTGKYLKAKEGWNQDGNGTDAYGFAALPGGFGKSDGSFGGFGHHGYWWSASEYNSTEAYYRRMQYEYDYATDDSYYKSGELSVRCFKEEK